MVPPMAGEAPALLLDAGAGPPGAGAPPAGGGPPGAGPPGAGPPGAGPPAGGGPGRRSAAAAGLRVVMIPDQTEPEEDIRPLLFAVVPTLSALVDLV